MNFSYLCSRCREICGTIIVGCTNVMKKIILSVLILLLGIVCLSGCQNRVTAVIMVNPVNGDVPEGVNSIERNIIIRSVDSVTVEDIIK